MPRIPSPAGATGVAGVWRLPDPEWDDRWEHIHVAERTKERLLNYALLVLRPRAGASSVRLPLHRVLMLSGPPGTGKTTLARGLGQRTAAALAQEGVAETIFVEIDSHAFASELLGGSQRSVAQLMVRTVPNFAIDGGPVVVLLDEIENLAVERQAVSMQANPIDVHRATNAVLTGLDSLAERFQNLLLVCTTNFPIGVDSALVSRLDLTVEVPPPDRRLARRILVDTLRSLRPDAEDDSPELEKVLDLADGLDARRLRKLVIEGVIARRDLVMAPETVTWGDLVASLEMSR